METLQSWLAALAGDHLLQFALLFLATFVAEEAAMVGGAGLAAAGELSAPWAAAAVFGGIVLSDWFFYWVGHLAQRVSWLRRRLSTATLERGRGYLGGDLPLALLVARLVPGLVYPIFMSCGFLGIGFRRFALLNLLIVVPYTALLFGGTLLLGELLFAYLENWGWLVLAAYAVVLILLLRWRGRRAAARGSSAPGGPAPR